MARLLIADDKVTIDMSRGEKFEAAHGDQSFPRNAITGVRAVLDCIAEVHGLKWAGTELPGIRVGASMTPTASPSPFATATIPGLSSIWLTASTATDLGSRRSRPYIVELRPLNPARANLPARPPFDAAR